MIALGIDPGTRNLGWGVVRREGTRLLHVGHGVIRMNGEWELPRRLAKLFDELSEVTANHRPDFGSVEGIFFDKNAQSAAKLGHARGVVLLVLERAGVSVFEHAPSRVKRAITGNGQAEKSQVAQMVTSILGLAEVPAADAADALAIAMTQLKVSGNLPSARKKSATSGSRGGLPSHFVEAMARGKARR